MISRLTTAVAATALAAAFSPVLAQGLKHDAPSEPNSKEAVHATMRVLVEQIAALRAAGAPQAEIARLERQLESWSATLGGDLPVRSGAASAVLAPTWTPAGGTQSAVAVSCAGTPTTASFVGTAGAITPPLAYQGVTFTTVVSGAGPYLWDLDLNTAITHTSSGELDITLESPSGTIVTITTDNGGTFDNNFNGTLWNDNANDPVTDRTFVNLVTVSPLSPEGRLAAFRGENPNGTWKLKILDDAAANTGTLVSWSLDVATLGGAPSETTTNFTSSPGTVIPTTAPPNIVTDTIAVSGIGNYLTKATLFLDIPHTFPGDLDITLTSPLGTIITVTTDNGGSNDNAFAGSLFDPDVTDTVTDHVYALLTLASPLSPEGSFDNLLGQDPNGTWTITVSDDANADGGTLVRWDLNLTTAPAPSPSAPANTPGVGGAIPDFTSTVTLVPTTYTAVVSTASAYLWDLDLTTAIAHTAGGDIDMTLTSPGGTTIVITTDNGGTLDDVFNGTLWDDNANDPAADRTYVNLTAATPLTPEGRLTAFRGQNPNGVWTLTITDDAAADNGTLSSWSLGVSTLPGAPSNLSTTFTQSPNLTIPATAPPTVVSDTIAVSGLANSITEVEVYIEVPHTFPGDLDITLTSPAGTIVTVTTDNGGTADNAFAATLFDGSSSDPATDHVYTVLVVVPVIGPEGALDMFTGENPNGNWVLTINDDANLDGGTFVRWDLTIRTCAPVVTFCFGDGSGTACPCGNAGIAGNGCASSLNANGANLTATGNPSIGADSVVLIGTGMPNSSALYFQGTAQLGGGAGAVFGDGLRCAGGSIIRLGTKSNSAGASQYPVGGDPSVSVRGLNVAGNVRTYQIWYRNAAVFCTTSTFNLSNGIQLTWVP